MVLQIWDGAVMALLLSPATRFLPEVARQAEPHLAVMRIADLMASGAPAAIAEFMAAHGNTKAKKVRSNAMPTSIVLAHTSSESTNGFMA